jgi:hypothetical protein
MTPSLAVKLELDVNTSADNLEVIPREKVAPLFSELFASADAITKEGERA